MFDANDPNVLEFRRSLEKLIQDAQHTAQLGFQVAREQVEDLVRTPGVPQGIDGLRQNLQNVAHELEGRVKDLIALTATYAQRATPSDNSAASSHGYTARVYQEPPAATESATAAGAGTPQGGADPAASHPTPNGEVPGQ